MQTTQEKIIQVRDIDFHLYKWDLRKIMRNQNIVIPLIKDPLVNAMAMADSEDQDAIVLSVIEGILTSLEGIDFEKLADRLFEGLYFRNPKGIQEPCSIDTLGVLGFDLSDIISLCVGIISYNYGDVLKKDLLASLTKMLGK